MELVLHWIHTVTYCKVNFRISPPPPLDRKIWHFYKANLAAIKRSMINFPWLDQLNLDTDTNWQVKTFTEIFLNIMFIPDETKRFIPRDPPWITKPIKTMLNRKNRLFKNYKEHRYKDEDTVRLRRNSYRMSKCSRNCKINVLKKLRKQSE